MRPTKQLIRALGETAQRLRSDDHGYSWAHATRCNCGVLAQTLLGIGEIELGAFGTCGTWTVSANYGHCAQTGLPTRRLFKALAACGVEASDYERIEYLDAKDANVFDVPANVAAWMDAQADLLEARRAAGERPERGAP